ncbi:MAG TPA: FAD binding domain-containing protein [Mycobacteriales bacterium]|nr:FAD binding domain-containing protein [Mycobacteriales bacterium]
MLLAAPRFALPETVAEAVAALAERPGAVLVAGGTEVLPDLLWRRRSAAGFVSLRRIPGLRTVVPGLTLGSGVTAARLQRPDVAAAAPALARSAASLGTPQVRAEATLGGNVVSALPYRNLLPVLLALDATLVLASAAGEREVPFDGFVLAPGQAALRPGEVLTAVRVPVRTGFQDYVKVGRRNAQYVATVSAAVVVDTAERRVRFGFGNAAATPLRLDEADRAATAAVDWSTGAVTLDGAEAVAELVRRGVDPPEDDAATAAYRRHALGVLARRLLLRAGGADDR